MAQEPDQRNRREPQQLDFFIDEPLDLWACLNNGYSSTIDIFDRLPIYMGRRASKKSNFSRKATLTMHHKQRPIEVEFVVWPARLEKKSGEFVFVQPGIRELHVESVVRALSIEKYKEKRTQWATEQWAEEEAKEPKFSCILSLYEIYAKLKELHHNYNYEEIREALNILSDTDIAIECRSDNDQQSRFTFPRRRVLDWTAHESKERGIWYCITYHPLIRQAIYGLDYQRHNYVLEHEKKLSPLAIGLFRRITHTFRQASLDRHYHIALSTIWREGAIPPSTTLSQARRLVEKAWGELAAADVLRVPDPFQTKMAGLEHDDDEPYVAEIRHGISRGGRPPIEDIVYHVWTSVTHNNFTAETSKLRRENA